MKRCAMLLALLACPLAASAQEAKAAVELSELAGTYLTETTGYQYVRLNAEACRCRFPNCDPPGARDHRTGTIAVAVEPASHAAFVTVVGHGPRFGEVWPSPKIPIVVEADGRFEGSLWVPATRRRNVREYEVEGSFGPDGAWLSSSGSRRRWAWKAPRPCAPGSASTRGCTWWVRGRATSGGGGLPRRLRCGGT